MPQKTESQAAQAMFGRSSAVADVTAARRPMKFEPQATSRIAKTTKTGLGEVTVCDRMCRRRRVFNACSQHSGEIIKTAWGLKNRPAAEGASACMLLIDRGAWIWNATRKMQQKLWRICASFRLIWTVLSSAGASARVGTQQSWADEDHHGAWAGEEDRR